MIRTSWPTLKPLSSALCFSSTTSPGVVGAFPSTRSSGLSRSLVSHENPWAGAPPVVTAFPLAFTSCAGPSTLPWASATPSTRPTVARTLSGKGGRSSSDTALEPCTTTSVLA